MFLYDVIECSPVLDNRRGACWMTIREGVCEDNINSLSLKEECCSSVGVAWGSPCEPCVAGGTHSGVMM